MSKRAPQLYGITVNEIARVCKVDLATARRWKRGATCPPATALMILERDLGCFDASWAGWRIRGEELIPPAAWPVRRDDALSVPLMHAQIQALRAELAETKKALQEALGRPQGEDQPEPHTWTIVMKAG